ncbi:Ech hydrogenase subunit A [Methanocella paludicola SANAE]|uniref:Ech hydrogenase subunit A n=1 Tax=Methanocella paludicola (strain DSM 17711 / JCM 13418 / NBRC 101707 / SANAE) TaxID=304371 RepID=D1YVT2_METPS|nr:proton-conducting transporter membrane subunit [Methanocella paludicola]BAI60554.1 Ech hydrogenase subunit A [Methanocella paludicola SANAE]
MDGSLLLLLMTIVPALFGIVCYLIPGFELKKYVVILCALVLMVASLLVLTGGAQTLSVESIGLGGLSMPLSPVILVLDYLLLLTFLYFGIKDKEYKAVLLAILQLIPLTYLEFFMPKAEHAAGITFVMDNLAIVMCLIVSIIGSLILIYSVGYMKGDRRASPFFLIMMVFLGDMNALVFANDLTWMFFFWEVTTLCSFLLIRHYHDEASIKASDRALWMNLLGGVSLICGIVLIESSYGTMFLSELSGMKATLPGFLSFLPASAALLPFAFMAFGAFTKSALMPFNSWLTGAMVAPTPVSALLHSSTMVNAGVYLLIRIAPLIVGSFLSTLIAVIGGFSFMFCALLALSQTDTKRILAYSTISYLGLIAMCTGINTGLALTAAVALLMFHAVSKGLLFLCVGEVQHETGARDIESMEGLVNRMPLVAYIMVIGLISLMAPPFGVFVGKWLAFQSVSTFTTISLSLLDIFFIIFGSIFSVFYYARWAGKLLATKPFEAPKKEHHDWFMELPLIVLVLGVFVTVALSTLFFSSLITLPSVYGSGPIEIGWSIQSAIGGFSPLGFLILFLIILLVPLVAIRVPKTAVTHTYACGTGEEPEIGGGYFQSIIGESVVLKYLDPVGVLLLVALFIAAVI